LKGFLHALHLHLGVPLVICLPIFTTSSLPQCIHFTDTFTTVNPQQNNRYPTYKLD